MRTVTISPAQLGALHAFQEVMNEAPLFDRLPALEVRRALLGRMIECGGSQLEALVTSEIQPTPGDWWQSYVSFKHSEAYVKRNRRFLEIFLSVTRNRSVSMEEHQALYGLIGLLAEIAHAVATGKPHILFMLPMEMRMPVHEVPPAARPLTEFLQRHLRFVHYTGPTSMLASDGDTLHRFIEMLQSAAYSEYGNVHDALADQSIHLETLIREVEHQGVNLVNDNLSCLRFGEQGLAAFSPTAEAADQIHELVSPDAGELLAASLEGAAQNGRRLIFYEYDSLRLGMLKNRCKQLNS